MKLTTKRHIAAWMLLAVFVPMFLMASLHVHIDGAVAASECTDCVHHNCHGHLIQTASWAHDCVLCQFLTLTMLTAALVAVTLYVHVCKNIHAQSLRGYHATCCGITITRGPPSV